MEACELTYREREPIDLRRAVEQHDAYCQMLRDCGATVRVLDSHPELPDCVFVEDTAIVLDELAILTSMGTASRRAEVAHIEPMLREYRDLRRIDLPATIEGGDVLRVGRSLLVGLSSRTNTLGIDALRTIAAPLGYRVTAIPVHGCLHFKTACTALPDGRLLVNPAWLDVRTLPTNNIVPVPEQEPLGANIALVGDTVCAAAEFVRTNDMIRALGFEVRTTPLSETAKAEGAVTCSSLIFRGQRPLGAGASDGIHSNGGNGST
jgi:dimethylargininase